MSKRKKNSGPFLFGVVIVALAAVGWGAGPGGWFRQDDGQAVEGAVVLRGPLRISELAHGNLKAKNAARLVNELEGRATILFLAEEGVRIEAGELVCALDVSNLVDRRVTQEIAVKSTDADFTKAKEQYEIQEIQNESDIAEAELAQQFAELDLEKYLGSGGEGGAAVSEEQVAELAVGQGEWAHELAQADESITLAREELTQAEDTLKWTQDLFDKGFVQRTELERDELSLQRSSIKLEQAEREKKLLIRYGHQRRLAQLEADIESRKRDVQKIRKQALARLADNEAARESARFRLEREHEKLDKIDEQIAKGEIYAPEAGNLVYSRARSHRGQGGEVPVEGGEVHERQEIATIPRSGGMIVDVSLPETKLEKGEVGKRCFVTIDAIRDQVFEGEVAFVAAIADSGSWMTNPNQRLYKTEVTLFDTVPEMRPGMSCEIEILVEDLEDVLYIPRYAVFPDGDCNVCFVSEGGQVEPREVEIGPDNSKWVQVTKGLSEGETVLLSPPPSWAPAAPTQTEQRPSERPADMGGRAAEGGGGSTSAPGSGSGPAADSRSGERSGEEPGERPRGEGRGQRGEGMDPEMRRQMRERFEKMTPEERKAAIERMRGGGGQ